MNPKVTLSIVLSLLTLFFTVHGIVSCHLLKEAQEKPHQETVQHKTPDFAAITNTSEKKQAFFNYLSPFIQAENARLTALRNSIHQQPLQPLSARAKQLAAQYRLQPDRGLMTQASLKHALLAKVDTIPPSLVLAQAAIESAWGTSRFATKGYNYFGQWCFTKGCGIVPSKRSHGAHHEVRRFQSPSDSVASYMLNLNSHPAYQTLRDNRLTQRQQGDSMNGCFLAEGLVNYSEKKEQYVESLKQLMRVNNLEEKHSSYCQKKKVIKIASSISQMTSPTTQQEETKDE